LVGSASSSNQLLVSGGALLTNNGFGNLGLNAGAVGNGATVTGPGSRWQVASLLLVGSNSAFNRLVITNGGRVTGTEGYVGFNTSASNNEAVVTGAGSMWSNSPTLFVGASSANNRLEISDGGWVAGNYGFIGSATSSVNNRVTVTGNNST